MHPNLAELYRRKVDELHVALTDPSTRGGGLRDPARPHRTGFCGGGGTGIGCWDRKSRQ
jgi:hypothetical protein